jgi:hypothetical protein
LSNFTSRKIQTKELEEVAAWMGTMEAVTKDGLTDVRNIFIIPIPAERLETGESEKGRYLPYYQGIALTLAAFEQVPHRATTKVSTLTCALTHEYFHQFMTHAGVSPLTREWMGLGGWSIAPNYPAPTRGRYEFSDWENLVETNYGFISSCDEFCDAAVKAIYDKDSFKDPAKRKFIEDNFLYYDGNKMARPNPEFIKVASRRIEPKKKFSFRVVRVKHE